MAEQIALAGAQFFRGGAYKPRTSPYAFQGMGEDGLKIMAEIRDKFGLRIVTEALDNESLDLVAEYADVIQIGARNMQNFSLLKRAGRTRKPVLVKRGMSATLDELLMAAEYVMSEGNYQVILCERGVRTFADHTRNTLDLSIVPAVQRLSHLPIIVDPSHGTGKRNMVLPLARAAAAVGADGLMIEVHHQPDKALSDGAQSLYPDQFVELMDEISQIAGAVHRSLPRGITVAEPVPSLSMTSVYREPCRGQELPLATVASARDYARAPLAVLAGPDHAGRSRLPATRFPQLSGELSRVRLHQQWRQQYRNCARPGQHAPGPRDRCRCRPFGSGGRTLAGTRCMW